MLGRTPLMGWATMLALLFRGGIALAHGPGQPAHQRFEEGDLKLESGEVIKDFSISYVTHGKLNEKKSNAILMTSSIAGNHHRIDFLINPGKALDTNKYFIIATDAIGHDCRSRSRRGCRGLAFGRLGKTSRILSGMMDFMQNDANTRAEATYP